MWRDDAVLVDIETRSPEDLRSSGGRRYALNPLTEILTVSWYDKGVESVWIPKLNAFTSTVKGLVDTHLPSHVKTYLGSNIPDPLVLLARSGRPFVAHNAWGFDAFVWAEKLPTDAQPAYWIDTDPLSRAVGLPGGLDKIGKELRGAGKHEEGRSRLKKFFKYKYTPGPGDLILIAAYCWDDTCGLLKTLWDYLGKHPLHPFEQAVLAAHQDINATGVRFDVELAAALKGLAEYASYQAFLRCQELSGGPSSPFKEEADLRKADKVINWILRTSAAMAGVLPQTAKSTPENVRYSLRKEVVEQLIRDTTDDGDDDGEGPRGEDGDEGQEIDLDSPQPVAIPSEIIDFLKARTAALRITKGKMDAALKRVVNGRLSELLVYYGAHPGRFAGRGMQIHNLPRPKDTVPIWSWEVKKKESDGTEKVRSGRGLTDLFDETKKLDPKQVQEILDEYAAAKTWAGKGVVTPANLDDAASAMLRGVLIPDAVESDDEDEYEFFVAGDYAAIEARGVGYTAEEDRILRLYREKIDPYLTMASKVYGEEIKNKKDPRRQVGKVIILGCGYQMGESKFAAYAAALGIDLEAAGVTARDCVSAFRDAFPKVAGERTGDYTEDGQPIRLGGIWGQLQAGILHTVETGETTRAGKVIFVKKRDDVWMLSLSGRPLVYRNAHIEHVIPSWEKGKRNPKRRQAVVYSSPRGFRNTLYGGKLLENYVQGPLSRDMLVDAMLRIRAEGLKVRFHVHDELIVSTKTEEDARRAMQIMSTPPVWAADFPLLVEADCMRRYSKSASPGLPSFNYENGVLV